ncbi:MAG: hypothetical protein LC804_24600, partial [Acidobacteria bacterium]|nr:hypothetical protein [Acidobacteriota bacterium]
MTPGSAPANEADDNPGAAREAFALPLIFLTVTLLGGYRAPAPVASRLGEASASLRFLAPSLGALVLALILLGVLARCGALVPVWLMSARRSSLGNLSGAVVLATLFAASAQIFNLLTPEAGLLHFLFSVFFFVLLWN